MDRIGVVGTSYRTTDVNTLSTAALPAGFPDESLVELARLSGFSEMVYLGTCNRVEFYFRGETRIHTNSLLFHLRRSLADLTGGACQLPDDDHLYVQFGREAVRHLFRVTAALDSMMVGEAQIAGQAKEAHERAHGAMLLGGILDQTFHEAFHLAKRIRTETELARRPVSLVTLVERLLHDHLAVQHGAGPDPGCRRDGPADPAPGPKRFPGPRGGGRQPDRRSGPRSWSATTLPPAPCPSRRCLPIRRRRGSWSPRPRPRRSWSDRARGRAPARPPAGGRGRCCWSTSPCPPTSTPRPATSPASCCTASRRCGGEAERNRQPPSGRDRPLRGADRAPAPGPPPPAARPRPVAGGQEPVRVVSARWRRRAVQHALAQGPRPPRRGRAGGASRRLARRTWSNAWCRCRCAGSKGPRGATRARSSTASSAASRPPGACPSCRRGAR